MVTDTKDHKMTIKSILCCWTIIEEGKAIFVNKCQNWWQLCANLILELELESEFQSFAGFVKLELNQWLKLPYEIEIRIELKVESQHEN